MPFSSRTPTLYGRGNLQVCRRGTSIVLAALHRPHTRNAFDDHMYNDLIDLMHETAQDDSVAALVLAGTGPFFSSGADLKQQGFQPQHGGRRTLEKPSGRFMMTLLAYPKLIAAAVHGPAVGIAVTMLLHMDLVHCRPQATFWAPFTRLALVPELCSSVTFPHVMGIPKANELLLLGRKISAQTAVDWNIASRVVVKNNMTSNNNKRTTGGDDHDPFDPSSLASQLCRDIDQQLLSLPLGNRTAQYFCQLVRNNSDRRNQLQQVCRQELQLLDERFDSGQVQIAAAQLHIGTARNKNKKKNQPQRSRL